MEERVTAEVEQEVIIYRRKQNANWIAWIGSYCRSDGTGISTFGAEELFSRNDTAQKKKSKFPPTESNL